MLKKIFQRQNHTMNSEDRPIARNKPNRPFSSVGLHKRGTFHQVVIKQGYLLKLPESSKLGSMKRPVRKWMVFGSLDSNFPFLDSYSSEETVFAGVPETTLSLKDCLSVLSNQKHPGISEFVFTIVLKGKRISLGTSSRTAMQEWCCAIERFLKSVGILDSVGGENDYSSVPPPPSPQLPLQRQARSLPPLPVENQNANENNETRQEDANEYQSSVGQYFNINVREGSLYVAMQLNLENQDGDTYRVIQNTDHLQGANHETDYIEQNVHPAPNPNKSPGSGSFINNGGICLNVISCDSPYDSVFPPLLDCAIDGTLDCFSLSARESDEHVIRKDDLNQSEESSNLPNESSNNFSDSISYAVLLSSKSSLERNILCRSLTKRCLNVVEQIESHKPIQISFPGPTEVSKLFNFAESDGAVWIIVRNPRELKKLNVCTHSLRTGDLLLSLDDRQIKQISSIPERVHRLVVKRSPHAKIVLIKHKFSRTMSCADEFFQELGLTMEPQTLKIQNLFPGGLVEKCGLSLMSEGRGSMCSWYVTDINQRQVLFLPWDKVGDIVRFSSFESVISLTIEYFDPSLDVKIPSRNK